MDKLVEKIAKLLVQPQWDVWHEHAIPLAKKIHQLYLSDTNIVEVDPDAELPETFFLAGFGYIQGHQLQVFLDEQGWVKKI